MAYDKTSYFLKEASQTTMVTKHPKYGEQVWFCLGDGRALGKPCAICGKKVGRIYFQPLSMIGNRNDRICARHAPDRKPVTRRESLKRITRNRNDKYRGYLRKIASKIVQGNRK